MSALTAELLSSLRPKRARSVWLARLGLVSDALVAAHGRPSLGNFRDPVREVFYILLSARTTDKQYRETYRRLAARFPSLSDMAAARAKDLRACIESGGLGPKRAAQIKRTARALLALGGDRPGRRLRAMPVREAFAFLTALPGVGPKSALCVLMYSLDADVFPVDVNVQRIAERLGTIPPKLSHHAAQRRLPPLVPAGRSRDLHVAMVVHGRKICLPRKPRCGLCPVRAHCKYGRGTARAEGIDIGD